MTEASRWADEAITEEERHPLLDHDGQRLLHELLEHRSAPRYNHTCGDRITAAKLANIQAFEAAVLSTPSFEVGRPPPWVMPFAARCVEQVPVYRPVRSMPGRFEDLPTCDRSDLIAGAHRFVPDDHPLDDLALFATTGTATGQAAMIPSNPVAAASYGVLLRAALAGHGLELRGGPGTVAVAQICWQRSTFTYAAISSFFGQAGLLKLNLNPDDWRSPGDAATFLDAIEAEVYTGDPVAFAKLAELESQHRPKALLSSAMSLPSELALRLEARFGCPVLDVYGMNEAGPIAVALPDGSGHRPLQPQLYIEILDEAGRTCPPGVVGEITLTGGFNTALPLLRYRTGDQASLAMRGTTAVLNGLVGRGPVSVETTTGSALNTIDVRAALNPLNLGNHTFHQRADGSVEVGLNPSLLSVGSLIAAEVRTALAPLFGSAPVNVHELSETIQGLRYSSDL